MRVKFKKWAIKLLKECKFASDLFDKDDFFYKKKTLNLEIGGGKGQFIVNIAKKNINDNFLMIERVPSIAGQAVKKIIENNISNVKIIYNDFINIINNIESESIKNIYLNFPDPWPKKKHEKRRLTSLFFFMCYYRILKKYGKIFFKTDCKELYEYSKISLMKNKNFIILNTLNNTLDDNNFITEYENKFKLENKIIYKLIIQKI